MANLPDCDIVASEFKINSLYKVYIWTNDKKRV